MKTIATTQRNTASTLHAHHSTHNVHSPLRRLTLLVTLLMTFALGARAAQYTISSGNNYLGINNGEIANINPYNATNCVWTGPDGNNGRFSMAVNGTTYYLLQYNGRLMVTTDQNWATNWTINGERLYTGTRYIRYNNGWTTANNPNNSTSGLDILAKVTYKDPTVITAEGVEILVGEEGQITYNLTSTSGTPVYDNVTFSINNTSIATINATTGVVTGVSAGTATVTVTAKNQNGTTACTAMCSVVVKEPVTLEYVFYYNGYYLAINDNGTDIEPVAEFDPETCIWRGVETGTGVYSATVDGTTYYLQLPSNDDFAITTNINQATRWTRNGNKLYSTGNRYVRYNDDWTTTGTSTRTGTDVLYPITQIINGTPIVEYAVGKANVSPETKTLDYLGMQEFTAQATVTKTTRTETYRHNSSQEGIITIYDETSETLSPTGYDWSLSSTDNLTLGSGTASTNSVTYSTASGTTKNVTLSVTAYYMDGTSKKQGTAGTATITVNEKKDNPTGITANDLTLAVDEQKSISYTLTPSNAYDNIVYNGFDNAIISITDGVVKGLKAGITTVTLTARNQNGTNSAHSATSTVTVTPNAPAIEFALGANITATISTTETGATIYYTTDGTTPTTSSPVYTAPVSVTAGATVKAIVEVMANGTPLTSPVAEALANAESGIVGNTVFLYDLEDHNWTYYQQPSNLPSGYPTTYLSSPNPRNVKITYRGGGVSGASAVAISALEGEGQNEMVYYKTLEKSVPGMSGDYPYTVISNPFSKRPKLNSTYYGFNGWKVISGGEYILEYDNDGKIGLDETIHFTNLDNNYTPNCMSAEIVFEATWTQATVKTGNSAPSFTNGTYETNFWVLTGNPNNAITVPTNCTMTARYPDGSVSWDGNFTRAITAGGNNAKVEFVNMYSTGDVNANGYTFTMGRGIVNSRNGGTLYGVNSNKACTNTVKIESGTYSNLYNFGDDIGKDNEVDQLMILGCDYDRVKNDNTKLLIRSNMYVGSSINLNRATNSLYVRTYIKSGNLGSTVNVAGNNGYTGAGGTNTYYFSVSGTHNAGRRFLCVEGGRLDGIAGGMDEINTQSTTARSFDLRVRGTAQIDGVVYGAAEFAGARGTRTMVFTGGLVKGWIAAGANGTQSDGGLLSGATYLYFGGNARTDSGNSKQVMNRSVGGNVFGAGCGYGATSSSGQITLGTNVVIADDAYVERGVYGGGSYGFTTATSNIYILGGTVDGKSGGVNGTNFREEIDGGVYGGACQNQGGTANVIMNDGIINGCVYGGSNYTGTLSGTSTVTLNGGTINGSLYGGGNGEGSANTNVTGAVQVNVYGGTVTDAVYGCNNNAGAPQSTVKVDIYGTDPAPAEGEYALHAVYGGGNKASYNRTPIVTVHNCDNSIEYVYGGGNAAAVAATDVTIWGGNVIGNVFGGGNGTVSPANVNGNATTKIYGGTILNVYGGSNSQGTIDGTINVTVNSQAEKSGDTPCTMNIGSVYGGGNLAASKVGKLTITCTGTDGRIDNVYGGANQANITGDIDLKINGGNIGNVFGGNNIKGDISGTISVTVGDNPNDCGVFKVDNVYGAGNLAPYGSASGTKGNYPVVNIYSGTVTNNVFGGGLGESAIVYGSPQVTIGDNNDDHQVTIKGDVYGGGDAANVEGIPVVKVVNKCNTKIKNVYGGGNAADVNGTDVNIDGGTITGMVFGGGHGDKNANPQTEANVKGNVKVDITGGSIGKVFGGSNSKGNIGGKIALNINKGDDSCDMHIAEVYGGGNEAAGNAGTITIGCTGGEGEGIGDVYGGANAADINTPITLNITGGNISRVFGGNNTSGSIKGNIQVNVNWTGTCGVNALGNVYGAGNQAAYSGNTEVNILNGTVTGSVYGGGLGATAVVTGTTTVNIDGSAEGHSVAVTQNVLGGGDAAAVTGSTDVNIINGAISGSVFGGGNAAGVSKNGVVDVTGGTIASGVYGGSNASGTVGSTTVTLANGTIGTDAAHANVHGGGYGKETKVSGNVAVNIQGGTIYGDVYGGSALGTVNTSTSNTTAVNLTGGLVHGDAYGGGLGNSTTAADVNGNVTVTLNGTAFTLATTKDNENNIIPTSGRVFGCNNINGSPKGTVLVKVLKTVARDGEGNVKAKPTPNSGVYELQAVYGGGNLAAYKPTDPTAEGQFTSYTWGEKNVAHDNTDKPVQVVIDGCGVTSIEYVYGGGNAAATPATDVTVLGSYEIGSVFGGGNGKDKYTLDGGTTWNANNGADVGIIDAEAYSSSSDKSEGKYGTGNAMTSVLGGTVHNIFGGSNTLGNIVGEAIAYLDAASDCELNVDGIYGGGNEAYMDGSSGIQLGCIESLKEIYGGARNADVGGDINLTITSGHFDRVFGGNNLGGLVKGSITVNIEETGCNPITIGELYGCGNKAAYETPGDRHPTINIRSFTSIGNVYGGGLGEEAVVKGNPTININVVKGVNNAVEDWSYNGKTIDFGDGSTVTLPLHETGKIGAIGNVFGGGNAAAVIGNTQVNIGTENSVVFESLTGAERTKTVEGADIRGNVYGGGNQANVTGKTNVVIGK